MLWILVLLLASHEGEVADFLRASAEERFQMLARETMGGGGCPDALARKTTSSIVAKVVPRLELGREKGRLLVDVSFTNTGKEPEGLHKMYLLTAPNPRTDHLWIFDRSAGKWVGYTGPQGRPVVGKPDAYLVLKPGETRTFRNVDVTSNYVMPLEPNDLVAKVMFETLWRTGARDARVESACVPIKVVAAP